jgi:hypothetical protein
MEDSRGKYNIIRDRRQETGDRRQETGDRRQLPPSWGAIEQGAVRLRNV